MARGRTASNLTQVKKDSAEARKILGDMVKSYCTKPAEKKARAIALQLENVEQAERVLREEMQNHEAKLFGSFSEELDEEEVNETASDDSPEDEEEETEEEEEEEEEKPTPKKTEIPRPITAKTQAQQGKKK